MKKTKSFIIFFLVISTITNVFAQAVDSWITNGDQSQLLQKQSQISFTNSNPGSTITINPSTTYQTIDGFGFCLTEGSCEAILSLPQAQQDAILNEFFNPTTGMGNDVVRISIGASDLSSSSYSYCDNSTDLNNFSLNGPDLTYLIPVLKRILAINPNIKILATPWSAPKWMKTVNSWIGGELKGEYYQPYAEYFVKYLNAMRAQGIEIWAITVQNEPENPYNEPSMKMIDESQLWFINAHLGPTLRNAGYNTKIIAFDHNCDNTAYPIKICNGSTYVDGAAFHLYAGDISALTTVKNATNKNVYFTEQYTASTGDFSGDFSWHTQNVTIGAVNNWAKTSFEWNLANNQDYGPRTPSGCNTCKGAITVNNGTSYTRNVSYYIIAQLSKFVKTGAIRIGSTCTDGAFSQVAFKNTDGSYVVVVYNNSGGKNFTIGVGSKSFTSYVPGWSAITLKWNESIPSITGLVTTYKDCDYAGSSAGLSIGDYTLSQLNALGVLDNDISSIKVTEGYKLVLFDSDNFQGASVEVTSTTNCLVGIGWNDKASSIKVMTNGVTNMNGTYYLQNRKSKLYMDVVGGLGATGDGANVQQYNLLNNPNQQFSFTHMTNGTYKILSVLSQKSLDVQDASLADKGNIQQWSDYSANNQQFIVVSTGDGYYKLVGKQSGKIVEVVDASTAIEANVQQFTNNNQTCGQWKFIPINSGTNSNNCSGTVSTDKTDANLSVQYNYNFSTSGNTVTASIEFPEAKVGLTGWCTVNGVKSSQLYSVNAEYKKLEFSGNYTAGQEVSIQWEIAWAENHMTTHTFTYTVGDNCIATNIEKNMIQPLIYPNPAQNDVYITVDKNATISIYDMLGQMKYNNTLEKGINSIDISNYSKAMYVVKISTEDSFKTFILRKE